ncbi:hypothetical protein XU18_1847 [Perkinsela sp. CCAP 1560/4]|nr:hypothetical protein XU18_1847 [Perkinsela sp. CCAP 1560/4]|eukprot:KNH07315.1 hypothetical protein XU18_1847 [Perkinsela sp. CCAP 1560/4]
MANKTKNKGSPGRFSNDPSDEKCSLLADVTDKQDPSAGDVYSIDDESKRVSAMESPSTKPNVSIEADKPTSFPSGTAEERKSPLLSPFFPYTEKKGNITRNAKQPPISIAPPYRKPRVHRRSSSGKLAVMCVGEMIDLHTARKYYKLAGYVTSIRGDVLHVTNVKGYRTGSTLNEFNRKQNLALMLDHALSTRSQMQERFDFYIFQSGSVVWWGQDMESYRSVAERPFFYGAKNTLKKSLALSKYSCINWFRAVFGGITARFGKTLDFAEIEPSTLPEFVQQRYARATIEKLFPVWLNFSVFSGQPSEGAAGTTSTDLSDELFLEGLQRDHVFLQSELPAHKEAISHAFAQSVKLDVLEPIVDDLLELSRPLPKELSSMGQARITAKSVNKAKGELFLCRMNLRDLLDEPEYFWDFPWFDRYYGILRTDYSVEQRVVCLEDKLSAVQQILDMLGDQFSQEHNVRLEWIIIWLIIAAVVIAGLELYTQIMRLETRKKKLPSG